MQHHHHTNSHDYSPPPPPDIPAYMNQTPKADTGDHIKRKRPKRKKQNPLLLPLILVSIVAVVMSALYIHGSLVSSTPETNFAEALDLCEIEDDSPYISVVDEGDSLIMTSRGTESPGAPVEEIACVFLMLDVPTSIINRFDTTRALDGTQTGNWDDYEATWNYHPNSGSNITITVMDD